MNFSNIIITVYLTKLFINKSNDAISIQLWCNIKIGIVIEGVNDKVKKKYFGVSYI